MPQIDLAKLNKTRKKATKKFRPYDIDIPEPKKVEENIEVKPLATEDIQNNTSQVSPVQVPAIPQKSQEELEAEIKARLQKQWENELKLKLQEKEKELQEAKEQISQARKSKVALKDDLPRPTKNEVNNLTRDFEGETLKNEILFKFAKSLHDMKPQTASMLLYIAEATEYGRYENVAIPREKLDKVVSSRFVNPCRDDLVEMGFISFISGYKENSNKKGTFYSLKP